MNLMFFVLVAALFLQGCKKEGSQTPLSLEDQGRNVYLSRCIACHNADPKQTGSLGPAVAGLSEEVIRAKVLAGKYPDGYVPMRSTRMMPPMPELEDKIIALHSYLAAAAQK
jgi:mono/diheme cytochrome c family protein